MKRRRYSRLPGFSMVEVMVVFAILGILLTIAAGVWIRAREQARAKTCMENQAKLFDATQEWALLTGAKLEDAPTYEILVGPEKFLKRTPICPIGPTPVVITAVGSKPVCPTNTSGHDTP